MTTAPQDAAEQTPVELERRMITAPDGRTLEVLLAGPSGALPFVLHNGTPSGPVVWPPTAAKIVARGMRLVLIARPGYAGSTPRPGRSVGDVTDDVTTVLDELGAGEFVTLGWSGGGPHALACSARLRGRCLATAVIASVAPYPAEGIDWMAGMGPENVEEFGAALDGAEAVTAYLEREAGQLRDITAPDIVAALGGLLCPPDQAVLTGAYAENMAKGLKSALSSGIEGWRDDDLAFTQDWGFDLADAGGVAIWQGSEDKMVPEAHGHWLAERIPGARTRWRQGDGHLTIAVTSFGDVLDDLAEISGR